MASLVFDIMKLDMKEVLKSRQNEGQSSSTPPKMDMNFKLKKGMNEGNQERHKRSLTTNFSSAKELVSSLDLNKKIKEGKLNLKNASKSQSKRRFIQSSGTFSPIPLSHSLDTLIQAQKSQSGYKNHKVIKIKKLHRNRKQIRSNPNLAFKHKPQLKLQQKDRISLDPKAQSMAVLNSIRTSSKKNQRMLKKDYKLGLVSPQAARVQTSSLEHLQKVYNFVKKKKLARRGKFKGKKRSGKMSELNICGENIRKVRKLRTRVPLSARNSQKAQTFSNSSNKNSVKNMEIMKTFQGAQNSTNVLQINNFSGLGYMGSPEIVRNSLKKLNLNQLGQYSQLFSHRSKKDKPSIVQSSRGGNKNHFILHPKIKSARKRSAKVSKPDSRGMKKSGGKSKSKTRKKRAKIEENIYSSISSQLFSKIKNRKGQ